MTILELEPLIAEVNQYLKANQKIHKDDPILANVILNRVIMERYTDALHTRLREAQLETTTLSQQAVKITKEQAEELLEKFDEHLDKRIQNWEKQFKTQSEQELLKIRAAALYSQIGGALILAAGALAIGIAIGNLVFH